MKSKIIYSISIEDIYTVAEESLGRKPSKAELKFVEEKIGDYIGWFDAIENVLNEFKQPKGDSK